MLFFVHLRSRALQNALRVSKLTRTWRRRTGDHKTKAWAITFKEDLETPLTSLVSSHRTVEFGVPLSETCSILEVMPVQLAIGTNTSVTIQREIIVG